MKTCTAKILLFLFCCSCVSLEQLDQTEEQTEPLHKVRFEASAQSKTTLSGPHVLWEPVDRIGVYSFPPNYSDLKDNNRCFYNTSEAGRIAYFEGNMQGDPAKHTVVAYYPYSSHATTFKLSKDVLASRLSDKQFQKAEGNGHLSRFDLLYAVKPADENIPRLAFSHALTFLQFNLKMSSSSSDVYVRQVRLKVSGSVLAGDFEIRNLTKGSPSVVPVGSNVQKTITLDIGNSPALNRVASFPVHMMLLPGKHSNMELTVVTNKGSFIQSGINGTGKMLAMGKKYTKTININSFSKGEIDLSATDHANCYLCPESNQDYRFDAKVCGNGATVEGLEAPKALTPSGVIVVWETTALGHVISGTPTLRDGYVHFTTTANTGNAVIAVVNKYGEIIWSWHLWKPESVPLAAEISTAGTAANNYRDICRYIIMDRNLGATNTRKRDVGAYGLVYQWGRKDPFRGCSKLNGGTANLIKTGNHENYGWILSTKPCTLEYAVSHPTTLCNYSVDWLKFQNDNLWGNPLKVNPAGGYEKGSKSIYDPCPPGWRVPPYDTFTGLEGSNYDTDELWFPKAGYRRTKDFTEKTSIEGRYWTSSPEPTTPRRGIYMSVHGNELHPSNYDYRYVVFSVRCVREDSVY